MLFVYDKSDAKLTHLYTNPRRAYKSLLLRLQTMGIGSWHDIPGWCDYDNIYQQRVDEAQDGQVFLEIGCAYGKSTACMAEAIKRSGKNLTFYAVDFWSMPIFPFQWFVNHLTQLRLLDYVIPLKMRSAQAAKFFGDNSLDFVYIDGSHEYNDVLEDLNLWYPKVKPGGWFCGHDYVFDEFPGVTSAVDHFFAPDDKPSVTINGRSWCTQKPQ
ncbi:MAG: class I SAM-dependent methyltransferase [Cyanobacteria bacterium HKST-UBA06]|nr:class I SAM-dependent methyltransferase [Cyanobacteria bacterium HKST-UBA06]